MLLVSTKDKNIIYNCPDYLVKDYLDTKEWEKYQKSKPKETKKD